MFLQRLTKWFTKTVSRIISHIHDALTYEPVREPVMSGHARTAPPSLMSADYLLPPNWLEDSRRLRPQLLTPDAPAQRRPVEKQSLERPEKPQLSGQARMTGASGQAARVGAPQPQQPSRAIPPSQAGRTIPASPADTNAHHDLVDDQVLRRRLMSLKHLVRLGIYNEGFASGLTPEQYHHSLGIDDDDGIGEE